MHLKTYRGYAMSNLRLGKGDREAINILYGNSFTPDKNNSKKKRPIFEDIDICNTKWDAVMNCRDEVFFFSDRRMWRVNRNGDLIEPLALRIHEFWQKFPKNKRIDAAYERQENVGKNNKTLWEKGSYTDLIS